jgi:hypothetical protein
VKAANVKWVGSLLVSEMRREMGMMGIEPHGKSWELSSRLQDALWDGQGRSPNFLNWNEPQLSPHEAAVLLAKTVNLTITPDERGATIMPLEEPAFFKATEDENYLVSAISGDTEKKKNKSLNSRFLDSTPVGLPKELADVTTKYRTKMLAKTGGALESRKLYQDKGKGDAEALNFSRSHLMRTQQVASTAGSKWMLGSGVSEVLEYLERRSMGIGLLPGFETSQDDIKTFIGQVPAAVKSVHVCDEIFDHQPSSPAENVDSNAEMADTVPRPSSALSSFFGSIFGSSLSSPNKSTRDRAIYSSRPAVLAPWRKCIESYATSQSVTTSQIVLVSDNNDVLRAGREACCYTVALNPPGERKVDVYCDSNVESISELKDIINHVNGISYRSS